MFKIISTCKGGGYQYCRTDPPHPRRNAKGLYPLHRVLAENKLGRLLEPNEVVHHRDEDKKNDSPSNLEVKSRSEHSKDHAVLAELMRFTCPCGEEFELKPHRARTRLRQSLTGTLCCSRHCGRKYAAEKMK